MNNCRLRAHARERQILLETYPPTMDEQTLEQLNIVGHRQYTLELKGDKDEFAPAQPEEVMLNVVLYSPEISTLDEDAIPSTNVKVPKTAKFQDILKTIGDTINMDCTIGHARMFRKQKGQRYEDTKLQPLVMEENMSKTLKDMQLYQGSFVYLEPIKGEGHPSQWLKLLEADKLKIFVQFNNPFETNPESLSPEYIHQVNTSKTATLQTLKELIGAKINLKSTEFIVRRGGKTGPELTELERTLGALNLLRDTTLYLALGVPGKPQEVRVQLSEASLSTSETEDLETYTILEPRELFLAPETTVAQIKDTISHNLLLERKEEISPARIRLRERCGERLGKVYTDTSQIKYYGLYDNKTMAFQVLGEEEVLDGNDVVVVVREWDPKTWSLSPRQELRLKRTWRLHDLSYHICNQFPHFRSKLPTLAISKINSLWSFKRGELLGLTVASS
jgi:hypothetical protein